MYIIQAESTKQAGSVRPTVTVHIRHIVIKVGALYEASHLYIMPVIVPTLIMSPQSLPFRVILRGQIIWLKTRYSSEALTSLWCLRRASRGAVA